MIKNEPNFLKISFENNLPNDSEFKFFPENSLKTKSDFLKLQDAEIYYEVTGDGPALIFVHGLGGNHLSWWQQIPYFSDRYKCINFSHRGFAISKNFSNRIGHEVFSEDLHALIENLGLNEVYLVAQSMGGWTSLTYTLKFPKKVKGLVLTSTSGTIDFTKAKNFDSEEYSRWEKDAELQKIKLKEKRILPAIGQQMMDENPYLAHIYEQIYNLTPYSYKEFIRANIKSNRVLSPDVFKFLEIPILFITGANDILFPPSGGSAVAAELKNTHCVNFENTGHSVYFQKPDDFNRVVDEFLSAVSYIKPKNKF